MTSTVKPEGGPGDPELAARMFAAQAHAEARLGRRLTLKEIGEAVAQRTGRGTPAPSVVRRWLRGRAEANRDTLYALAQLFGVSPGWLAFGVGSATLPGETPPAGRLPASEDELRALAAQALRGMGQEDTGA